MSLKSFFKRYMPEHHKIREHEYIRHFGSLLHDPNIWHLSRRSSAGGVAIGLFCAFIPLPIQAITSAALAILFRVNLPLSVLFTLVSNPVTIAPMFIFAYKLGTKILDVPVRQVEFEPVLHKLIHIWEPLLLGCFILASISAITGYVAVRMLWRLAAVRKWEERRLRNRKKAEERSQETE
jgi:uncharacterized protein (DUF2062 family)